GEKLFARRILNRSHIDLLCAIRRSTCGGSTSLAIAAGGQKRSEGAFGSWVTIKDVAAGGATSGTVSEKRASIRFRTVARVSGVTIGARQAVATASAVEIASEAETATVASAAVAVGSVAVVDRGDPGEAACRRKSSAPDRARSSSSIRRRASASSSATK